MTAVDHTAAGTGSPPAPVLGGIDHLEWWVGNARAFTGFLESAFGFDVVPVTDPALPQSGAWAKPRVSMQ